MNDGFLYPYPVYMEHQVQACKILLVNETITLAYKKTIFLFLFICIFQIFSCATDKTRFGKKAGLLENMGNSLFLAGKPREALPYLLETEKMEPLNPVVQRELALIYQNIYQYDLAFVHIEKAIKLKPDFSEAYNDMGVFYSQQGKLEDALDCFNKALKNVLYKTPYFAYHNIGLVYFRMKDYNKAIEFYKKSISLSPSYMEAYFDLANTYEVLGDNVKTINTYKKIIDLGPGSLAPYLALAKVYKKTGQIDMAIDKLNYIVGIDPRSPIAHEAIKLLDEIQSR